MVEGFIQRPPIRKSGQFVRPSHRFDLLEQTVSDLLKSGVLKVVGT
jgi:hypothetical protein